MEEFQSACDSLQEMHLVPFRPLIKRPGNSTDLCHGRETIIQLRDISVAFPGITPGPVNGNSSSARSVLSWEVRLIVGTRSNLAHGFLPFLPNSTSINCLHRVRPDNSTPVFPAKRSKRRHV